MILKFEGALLRKRFRNRCRWYLIHGPKSPAMASCNIDRPFFSPNRIYFGIFFDIFVSKMMWSNRAEGERERARTCTENWDYFKRTKINVISKQMLLVEIPRGIELWNVRMGTRKIDIFFTFSLSFLIRVNFNLILWLVYLLVLLKRQMPHELYMRWYVRFKLLSQYSHFNGSPRRTKRNPALVKVKCMKRFKVLSRRLFPNKIFESNAFTGGMFLDYLWRVSNWIGCDGFAMTWSLGASDELVVSEIFVAIHLKTRCWLVFLCWLRRDDTLKRL